MRSLTYTNPLGTQILLFLDPYLITKLDGVELPPTTQEQQTAPYQDGFTDLDLLLNGRVVIVEGVISKRDLPTIYADRAILLAALNPKLGLGVLTFQNDTGTYTAIARPTVALMPNKDFTTPFQTWHFEFSCPDPYWYASVASSVLLQIVTGGMIFPFSFPLMFGTYVGTLGQVAVNNGDSITPVTITISGPSKNPIVTNQTTGLLIKCNITLALGDILVISTQFGSKSVVKISGGVSTNQMPTLDASSNFWQLALGNNQILFVDDNLDVRESCLVTWNNRFSGR